VAAFFKSNNIIKADLDIVYKNVARRYESNTMDFYGFLDGVEQLATKIYRKETLNESVQLFLEKANAHFDALAKKS